MSTVASENKQVFKTSQDQKSPAQNSFPTEMVIGLLDILNQDFERKSKALNFQHHQPRILSSKGLGVDLQEFTFNAGSHNVLYGKAGTRIILLADTFVPSRKENGPLIKFYLKEVYKKSEAIRENLSTNTTEFQFLESGGMMNTRAVDSQGNVLMPQNIFQADLPASQRPLLPGMDLYNGLTNRRQTTWQRDNKSQIDARQDWATMKGIYRYSFRTLRMNWLNVDRQTKEQDVSTIKMSTTHKNSQILCVAKSNFAIYSGLPFFAERQIMVPRNQEYSIVAIRVENGQGYMTMQDISASEKVIDVQLDYQPCTFEAIKEKLETLDK